MDELAKRFADLAEKYGPNVAEAAMQAARVEAYSSLVASLFVLAAGVALAFAGRFLWRVKMKDQFEEPMVHALGAAIIGIGGIVVIVAVAQIADPWLWATFKNPELWLAKKAFKI